MDVSSSPLSADNTDGTVALFKPGSEKVKTTPAGEYLTAALNDFDPEQYDGVAAISDGANKLLMLRLHEENEKLFDRLTEKASLVGSPQVSSPLSKGMANIQSRDLGRFYTTQQNNSINFEVYFLFPLNLLTVA
uniref:Uncharacterized protein n=1 Tax=Rhizophora mucronata TaxID=61149 RepID=A0A2P2MB64_RHIMU